MTSRSERGQAAVLTIVALTAMLGMAALVLDLGSWFRAQRATQAAADAAALAAAQALPHSPSEAHALALEYLGKNGGGDATITFNARPTPNDTVSVRVERPAPGIFARLFGVDSVTVGGKAAARASGLEEARWVAPIVVNVRHPMLNCSQAAGRPVPCFGQQTQLTLVNLHEPGSRDAAGSFGLINLDRSSGGNIGASTLAAWVTRGFDQFMELGEYDAAPSSNFNNSQFKSALGVRVGDELLFPIYRTIVGPGSGAKYDIVGWVGFRVSDFDASGSSGTLRGAFVRVVWEGIESRTGDRGDYGARAIRLVE